MTDIKRHRILIIFGTRPEAIKMAPIILGLRTRPEHFDPIVLVTAQHRQMLDQVLQIFSILPDHDLDAMSHQQSLTDLSTQLLPGLSRIMHDCRPDLVLVQGDTSTTVLAALAAFYNRIPVGHIEAGLRTGDKYAPFPEEINRRLAGVIADLHFAPTPTARDNLLREGTPAEQIFVTGNTVIDAMLTTAAATAGRIPSVLAGIPDDRRLILLTTHRRESLGEPLRRTYRAIRRIVKEFPDVEVVFPIHLNPEVRESAEEELGGIDRVRLCGPMDYASFVGVMNRSHLVLTDSGGIQEEAPALGKPVLLLRNITERPEAVRAGTVRLVGTGYEAVYQETALLLQDSARYARMSQAVNPYGDGRAARRIVEFLLWLNGYGERPEAYVPPDPLLPKAAEDNMPVDKTCRTGYDGFTLIDDRA